MCVCVCFPFRPKWNEFLDIGVSSSVQHWQALLKTPLDSFSSQFDGSNSQGKHTDEMESRLRLIRIQFQRIFIELDLFTPAYTKHIPDFLGSWSQECRYCYWDLDLAVSGAICPVFKTIAWRKIYSPVKSIKNTALTACRMCVSLCTCVLIAAAICSSVSPPHRVEISLWSLETWLKQTFSHEQERLPLFVLLYAPRANLQSNS